MAGPFNTRLLYRQLLKTAKRFPSIKRDGILSDIRIEFRANRDLTDPTKLQQARKVAVDGLHMMEQYTNLDPKAKEWEVHLKGATLT